LGAIYAALAHSQSFDCRRATTVVEKAICGDAHLMQLDSALATSYRATAQRISPEGSKKLAESQRAWISDRDRHCATGTGDCIAEEYTERNNLLRSLLARTSDANPVIDIADPASLVGTWMVSRGSPEPASSNHVVSTSAHLPPSGATLVAKTGELCVVATPQAKICNPFGLAVEERTKGMKGVDPSIAAESVILLTYFDGRADFSLVLDRNQELSASSRVCEANGTDCRWLKQHWQPASPDAAVKVYRVFDER
jgi:uncharacterized protein